MVYKLYFKESSSTPSFKLTLSAESAKRRKVYPFSWQSISPSKQRVPRSNRKVVFISSGERPFKLLGERFSSPVRCPLIRGNPNSLYPARRLDDNEETFRRYFEGKKQEYLHLLTSTDFFNAETEELEIMTADLMRRRKSLFLNWIQQLFLDNIDVPDVEVGILNLMRLYTYEELEPASQMIALAARDMNDNRVKDAAFSLFGHWGDVRALKLLEAYDVPSDPWMAVKYETLISDIKQYAIR